MTVDSLKTVFILDDQYSAGAGRATSATKNLSNAFGNGGASGLGGAASFALAELDASTPVLAEVVSVFKTAAITAIGFGVALTGMGLDAMRTAGDMESLKLGLQVYAGSAEETERQLKRLREVAKMPGLGFREAIEGSIRLQAVGANSRLAERALMAFGNAVATSGGGKEELDGVLVALSQIVSKGVVSAEEIGQIAERVPQIRKVMMDAFGTASGEEIQKLGISAEDFVMRITGAFEKLPPAMTGAKNAFENFEDIGDRAIVQIGEALNKALLPALNDLSGFVDFLERNNIFGTMVTGMLEATNNTSAFGDAIKNALGTVKDISGETGHILAGPIAFMANSTDFGDVLVRAASLAVTIVGKIPAIFNAAMTIIDEQMTSIRSFADSIIGMINGIIDLLNNGLQTKASIGGFNLKLNVGGRDSKNKINTLQKFSPDPGKEKEEKKGLSPGEQAMKKALDGLFEPPVYRAYRNDKQTNSLLGDKDPGGFINAATATASNTERIAVATEKMVDIQTQLQGGSTLAKNVTSEYGQFRGGRGRPGASQIHSLLSQVGEIIEATLGTQEVVAQRRRMAF